MADQATLAAAPEAAPAKKGKSKLLMILVLVLVVAGAAYWFVLKPKDSAAAAVPPPPEKGAVVALEPIYINLAQSHFLKLGLALQGTKTANVKELDGSEALDFAIEVFSGQEMDKLSDTEVRAEFKKDLVEKVTEAYPDEVMDVYFTEFVMQ